MHTTNLVTEQVNEEVEPRGMMLWIWAMLDISVDIATHVTCLVMRLQIVDIVHDEGMSHNKISATIIITNQDMLLDSTEERMSG